jgi:ATP-dependent Lon protease
MVAMISALQDSRALLVAKGKQIKALKAALSQQQQQLSAAQQQQQQQQQQQVQAAIEREVAKAKELEDVRSENQRLKTRMLLVENERAREQRERAAERAEVDKERATLAASVTGGGGGGRGAALSEGEAERVRRLEDDIARLTQALQEAEKEHELLGQQLEEEITKSRDLRKGATENMAQMEREFAKEHGILRASLAAAEAQVQLLRRQYLYFCTSKASKSAYCVQVWQRRRRRCSG